MFVLCCHFHGWAQTEAEEGGGGRFPSVQHTERTIQGKEENKSVNDPHPLISSAVTETFPTARLLQHEGLNSFFSSLVLQVGERIPDIEQGERLVFLHTTAGCTILPSPIHFNEKTECQASVICQLNVTDWLSHSDALDRISHSIGFQTARSQWGGYNQSELKIKASKKTN